MPRCLGSESPIIDGKLKDVGRTMTREQLVEHCREVIQRQRPSNRVNEVRINGEMVGPKGDNMIIHEHVMRMMLRTKQSLCQSDIDLLCDYAQTCGQHKNKRVLSKSCTDRVNRASNKLAAQP